MTLLKFEKLPKIDFPLMLIGTILRKKEYKKDREQKCIVLLSLEEAMKPLNFDLNQSPNNDDAQQDVEETLLQRDDFNFDLNQAPSQVNVHEHDFLEASCEFDVQLEFENNSEREDDATREGRDESEALLDEYEVDPLHMEVDESEELPHEYHVFASENQGTCRRRKFLSNDDRKAISHLMSLHYNCDGKLKRGTYKFVASLYSVSISTIRRIWKRTKETGEVCHKKTKNCGRKRVQIDHDQFRQIPLSKSSNLRDLASALNISKSALQRAQKRGTIRRHSNVIKSFFE